MLNINISTPATIMKLLKKKYKQKRLYLNLTQEGLASRSGVSLGSLKRFETSGNISFESLLKLSLVLECLDDFKDIANTAQEQINTIEEIINHKDKKIKKRGRIR